jgi:hypothetical protein
VPAEVNLAALDRLDALQDEARAMIAANFKVRHGKLLAERVLTDEKLINRLDPL